MLFWKFLVFLMIQWMLAVWSLVPLAFLNPAWTYGHSQFTYSWSLIWRILSITLQTWEMWVQLLGRESLEKEMATHSSILAQKIPWTGEPGGLQSTGSQRAGHDLGTKEQEVWKLLSCVRLFATLWTVAHQASLSMGFSGQEYWSGLPFSPPGNLPHPGIAAPVSLALEADSLPLSR